MTNTVTPAATPNATINFVKASVEGEGGCRNDAGQDTAPTLIAE